MTNIYDLANELERGIRALPEYKTLVEKKEAIAADAEASALSGHAGWRWYPPPWAPAP